MEIFTALALVLLSYLLKREFTFKRKNNGLLVNVSYISIVALAMFIMLSK